MSWKTTRALSATLFLGVAAIAATDLVSSAPSYAAAATETKNKALVDAINGAQADFKAGRFADALAKAKEADAIREDKPAALNPLIHGMIVKYAIEAKDYASALAQIDKNIAANEGTKAENLKQAMSISFLMKNNTKAQEYAGQLGNTFKTRTRLLLQVRWATADQGREALAL